LVCYREDCNFLVCDIRDEFQLDLVSVTVVRLAKPANVIVGRSIGIIQNSNTAATSQTEPELAKDCD
jgi:hypothetical protein